MNYVPQKVPLEQLIVKVEAQVAVTVKQAVEDIRVRKLVVAAE